MSLSRGRALCRNAREVESPVGGKVMVRGGGVGGTTESQSSRLSLCMTLVLLSSVRSARTQVFARTLPQPSSDETET